MLRVNRSLRYPLVTILLLLSTMPFAVTVQCCHFTLLHLGLSRYELLGQASLVETFLLVRSELLAVNGFAEKTCLCSCCIYWIIFILPSICSSPFFQLYYYHVQTAETNLLLVVRWKKYWMYWLWGLNSGTLLSPHLKAGVGDCLRKTWGKEIQQRMFSRQCPEIIVAWLWVSFTSRVVPTQQQVPAQQKMSRILS